jgi:hypothetical protein
LDRFIHFLGKSTDSCPGESNDFGSNKSRILGRASDRQRGEQEGRREDRTNGATFLAALRGSRWFYFRRFAQTAAGSRWRSRSTVGTIHTKPGVRIVATAASARLRLSSWLRKAPSIALPRKPPEASLRTFTTTRPENGGAVGRSWKTRCRRAVRRFVRALQVRHVSEKKRPSEGLCFSRWRFEFYAVAAGEFPYGQKCGAIIRSSSSPEINAL